MKKTYNSFEEALKNFKPQAQVKEEKSIKPQTQKQPTDDKESIGKISIPK